MKHDNAVRELSADELDLVGGGVGGFAFELTIAPQKTTLAASGVGDGPIGGNLGADGGSGLGGLIGGIVGSLL